MGGDSIATDQLQETCTRILTQELMRSALLV
jgi:hypothetical protein